MFRTIYSAIRRLLHSLLLIRFIFIGMILQTYEAQILGVTVSAVARVLRKEPEDAYPTGEDEFGNAISKTL